MAARSRVEEEENAVALDLFLALADVLVGGDSELRYGLAGRGR
jgi:hypothetical protein